MHVLRVGLKYQRDKYEFDVFNIVVTQNIPPGRIKISTMLRIISVLVSLSTPNSGIILNINIRNAIFSSLPRTLSPGSKRISNIAKSEM